MIQRVYISAQLDDGIVFIHCVFKTSPLTVASICLTVFCIVLPEYDMNQK